MGEVLDHGIELLVLQPDVTHRAAIDIRTSYGEIVGMRGSGTNLEVRGRGGDRQRVTAGSLLARIDQRPQQNVCLIENIPDSIEDTSI